MGNFTRENKNPSIGSIYFNVKKGAAEEVREKLKKAVQWMKDTEVFLSVSIKNDAGDYTKYAAFFNGFKNAAKDPDMKIKISEGGSAGTVMKQTAPKDDLPF